MNISGWLKEFIIEQRCIPWSVYTNYCRLRNNIFNINSRRYWDTIWARERKDIPEHRFYPHIYNKIVDLVPQGSEVADVGCGLGILMERLKTEKACNVFGIDISSAAAEFVNHKGMDALVAKVPPIPLNSESFDVVIGTEIIEHVSKPDELIEEMIRILRPSGHIIISVPDKTMDPHVSREHLRTYDKGSLFDTLLRHTKLRRIQVFEAKEELQTYNHFIAVGEKCQK
jgi:2-polyprenyl-3-methyl-5-hydroxy-6-metoxy-1,4-benzoquinol methylase